jgi:hypothetical protein
VATLYVLAHSQLFWWIVVATAPLLAAWTGYLLKSYLDGRNIRHGFRLLSQVMSYEVGVNNAYTLRYTTKVKAEANRMMVYPVGYQWSGEHDGKVPRILYPDQKLVGVVDKYDTEKNLAKVASYKESVASEDDWNYWFVCFDKALYKGETAVIKYVQEFEDKKKIAKPSLYYLVSTPLDHLELNVKFSTDRVPSSVTCSYVKLSDRRKSYPAKGVHFDPDNKWATWIVEKPKFGYCYRIDWQYK